MSGTDERRDNLDRRDLIKRGAAAAAGAGLLGTVMAEAGAAAPAPVAKPNASAAQAAGGTFRLVDATEPNSLDPSIGTGPFSHVVLAMFEGLLKYNETFEPQPLLATDWTVSEDTLSWTFNLKQGVTFHDGSEFNADAVKFSFDRLLDPAFGAGRRAIFTVISEVVVDSPTAVTFKTTKPFPDLHFLMADQSACIVSPQSATSLGNEEFGLHPVGTGPFSFVEWVPNDHITLQRYDGYHDTPALPAEIVLRVVPEASAREAMLLAGEADLIVSPPTESISSLQEKSDEYTVYIYNSLSQVTSEMRQSQPPFSVKEVRQAMNYAIDRQAIIDTIMGGLGVVCDSPAPPGVWGGVALEPYAYDPDKAKELLGQGGYPDGFDGNLFYVSGRWAGDDQVTQALQAYWAQVGINIELNRIDMGSLGDYLGDDPDNRAGWTTMQIRSSTYLDYHLYRLFHSSSTLAEGAQRSAYVNAQVDELLNTARSTFVEADRLAAYEEAQRIIWDDAAFIWVFVLSNVVAYRAGVTGVVIHSNADIFLKDAVLPA